MPSFMTFSKDGARAAAISEGNDRVVLLEVAVDGLVVLGAVACPGGPAHVSFDRTERFVLTASYGSGESRVYPVSDAAALGHAVSTVDTGRHTHALVPSLDNRTLYAPSKGTDTIAILSFDEETGLAELRTRAEAPSGSGPRHLVLSKDGLFAFVSGENDCSVSSYSVRGGDLELLSTTSSLPRRQQEGETGSDLHLSENGRFLYASNRGHDSIAVFAVDDGALRLLGHESTHGQVPRNFCLLGSDTLIVANQESRSLSFYRISEDSGEMTFLGIQSIEERPFWVGNQQSH